MTDHYTDLTEIKEQMRQMACIEGVGLLLYGLTLINPADFCRGNKLWQSLLEGDLLLQVMRDDPSLYLPASDEYGRQSYLRRVVVEVYLRVVLRLGLGLSYRAELDSSYHPNLELMRGVLDWCAQWKKGENLPTEIREVPHKLALDKRLWDAGLKVSCAHVLYRYGDFRTLGQHRMIEAGPLVWRELKAQAESKWFELQRMPHEGVGDHIEKVLRWFEGHNEHPHECHYLRMCIVRGGRLRAYSA